MADNFYAQWFSRTQPRRLNIPEVTEAEKIFKAALQEITDPELRNKIDMAAGKISYAYEILGFCAGHFSQDSRSRAAFF